MCFRSGSTNHHYLFQDADGICTNQSIACRIQSCNNISAPNGGGSGGHGGGSGDGDKSNV